ncbi:MAG: carboxypeptidase-like regulatory domain-containing protein [Mucilaginibacter sp.]
MTTLQTINIPNPCLQSWQQMSSVESGRHCQQCCKTVVDFTSMTDRDIIAYLSLHNHVCGRLSQQQLNVINQQFDKENVTHSVKWRRWAVVLGFFGTVGYYKASAQVKPATVQTVVDSQRNNRSFALGKVVMAPNQGYHVIKGHITNEQGEPLPGVQISVTSSNVQAITDINGNYTLCAPTAVRQFSVSYIGYIGQTVTIDMAENSKCDINLKLAEVMMGDVVIVKKPSLIKKVYYKFIKRPIHNVLRKI